MPKHILIVTLAVAIGLLGAFSALAVEEPAAPKAEVQEPFTFTANFHWGFLMFSNREFFVLAGTRLKDADFSVGIGMNNGIWLGGHFYFFTNGNIGIYTGFELVRHQGIELLNFTPMFPIGFVFQTGRANVLVEASIGPALEGEEVAHQFGMGFTMMF